MNQDTYHLAAKELLSRRIAGTKAPRLNETYRPTNLEDALQIQVAMVEQYDGEIGGWKCLLPLAEDQLIVAPIFADTIHRGEACSFFADNNVARIEPEIAFVLASDLPANVDGYSDAQINEAIGSCHMALELMQSRFADDSDAEFYERLADGLVNQGMFVGPEIDREKAIAAANVNITVSQDTEVQTFEGKHPNLAPLSPVHWLVNFLTRRGISLKAGEAMITGSFCGIVEVEFNKLTSISYEGIGKYQVTFNAK
jgi:2-keto-4-pentenoate hydratase